MEVYKTIQSYAEVWQLPRIVSDTTKTLFKQANDAGITKGKSQESIIAAVLFIACRQHNVDRTFREIHALTKVSKRDCGRSFKMLEKFFARHNAQQQQKIQDNGGIVNPNEKYSTTTSTKAEDLCNRYCSQLGLSAEITKIARTLAGKMTSVGSLAGRSPLSAAAACIYFASHLMKNGKTPKEISAVAGVSDGTIRTAYKLLEAEKDKLIDPEWLKDGRGDLKYLPKL
jgi:transcription initiation factor TFIIB